MWIEGALPHHGLPATEFLQLCLSGDIDYLPDANVNKTKTSIRVFHCYWEGDNSPGLPCGGAWESHVDLSSLAAYESPC